MTLEVEEWWPANAGGRGEIEDGGAWLGRTKGEGVSMAGWSSSGISMQVGRQAGRNEVILRHREI